MNAGSFNDPPDSNGMAHFLEHMIFMGSEKYQREEEYGNHISENGGFCNAFTNLEDTNFTFEISYSGLEKALDMMSHNFYQPLFDEDVIEREIQAIESEFKMNSGDDTVRMLQILQNTTTDPNHIFNRFMWGSLKSLYYKEKRETLKDDLRTFFD